VEPFWRAAQFARAYISPQQEARIHTEARERERLVLEAVCWRSRSGAQWRFRPASDGAWNSVDTRFARWDDLGGWARLFERVAAEPDLQRVMLAATAVRAHACAAGAPKKTAVRRRKASGGRAAGAVRRSTSRWRPWAIR